VLAKSLLWIDCTGGLLVGVLVLSLSTWLSSLFAFPHELVLGMGVANLAYGTFSFSLARRAVRPRALLQLLASANMAWGVLCFITAGLLASQASAFGIAQLVFEGAYVAGLGMLEWRHLDLLLTASPS
jgi:hypothetical protein